MRFRFIALVSWLFSMPVSQKDKKNANKVIISILFVTALMVLFLVFKNDISDIITILFK